MAFDHASGKALLAIEEVLDEVRAIKWGTLNPSLRVRAIEGEPPPVSWAGRQRRRRCPSVSSSFSGLSLDSRRKKQAGGQPQPLWIHLSLKYKQVDPWVLRGGSHNPGGYEGHGEEDASRDGGAGSSLRRLRLNYCSAHRHHKEFVFKLAELACVKEIVREGAL